MRDAESKEESRMTYTAYCFHSKCWQVILGSTPLSISSCKTQRQIALIFYIPLSYLCYFIFCIVIDIYIGRDISLGCTLYYGLVVVGIESRKLLCDENVGR